MTSDNTMSIKFTVEIHTYYPLFTVMSDDYEICDNDDSIDWNFLGIKKPDGEEIPNAAGYLSRVYWYHDLSDQQKNDLMQERESNRQNEINNLE